MMWEYEIYKQIYDQIALDWKRWSIRTNAKKMVIGISGGKDSSIVAALAVSIFGKENVVGVLMPQGKQKDISDSYALVKHLDIKAHEINIEYAVESILLQLSENEILISDATKTNLPARIRMSTLFAVAQSEGGRVINTCNLSENLLGWSTIFGDHAGAYAPIQGLTATEVAEMGQLVLKLPKELCIKVPSDGLCGVTDEEKFGFTYKQFDNFIRFDTPLPFSKERKIYEMYKASRFKEQLVEIPGVKSFEIVLKNGSTQWLKDTLSFDFL